MRMIIGQAIGILDILFSYFIFSQKNNKSILKFKLMSDLMWVAHFMLIGAYTGMATTSLSLIREILFINRDKSKMLQSKWWIAVFCFGYCLCAAATWGGVWSLFPPVASCLATIGFWNRNVKTIRIVNLVVCVCMLIYGVATHSLATVINQIYTVVSIFVILVRVKKAGQTG